MFYFINNKLICDITDQQNTKDSVQIVYMLIRKATSSLPS